MRRRKFIKSTFTVGGGLMISSPINTYCNSPQPNSKSRVVVCQDPQVQEKPHHINSDRLLTILDNGMQALFDRDNPREAWKKIVKSDKTVGLKVNCLSGKGATHIQLVEAVCERLQQSGIKSENIIIWDRFNSDLEDGGFKINHKGRGIKCFGNDTMGFESDFEVYGSAASLICKTLTRACDTVINLPVLKDHGIAGVTISLKNMFGAIHNPNKYHLNVGDPYIPDVFMLPSIRKKVRLTICDALVAQYEGGPSYMPHWSWTYNGLIFSRDPVALDYSGWQIIEKERHNRGLKSLKQIGREPKYIATAADENHRLGTNNPEQIELACI